MGVTTRHELPYPAAPAPGDMPPPPPADAPPTQGGSLLERIAANREGIEALRVGTSRLRARVDPLRPRVVARLSEGTPRLAARVVRDSRPRAW